MCEFKLFICVFLSVTLYFADCRSSKRLRKTSKRVSVTELSISSSVSIRYANVLVRSLVENLETEDNEASFQVRIPHEAYITSFVIVTNGKTINAVVKEKNAATEVYNKAKEDGVSAGTVTQQTNVADDADRDIFNVKVNVAAQTTLEFRLQYEELIQKRAGKYIQKIFVDSDHVIPKLEVTCEFREKQKFKQFTYQTPIDVEKLYLSEEKVSDDGYFTRKIEWRPSETDQEYAQFGLENPFEIAYELEPPENGGMVYVNDNGEFVHMFSTPCEETKVMMKQIVFVIDISGSMQNDPIKQVRQTMEEILTKLRVNDFFNIVIFNEKSILWKKSFQQATPYNIANAKEFVDNKVIAEGSTNINDALLQAIRLFGQESEFDGNERSGQIVVFLTDGSPTVGVQDRDKIRSNVREMNYYEGEKCCKSTIYTIAFGKGAAIDFLRVLANENEGSLTIIRERNDDGELLKVYDGIENPYLKDIEFIFKVDNKIVPKENMTRAHFRQYDCGEELVVAGWTFPEAEIQPVIRAFGINDNVTFDGVPTFRARNVTAKTLSRLLVYEMVKHLLKDAETATDPYRTTILNEQALNLSLEHGFVTSLTSLVVTDYTPKKVSAAASNRMFSNVNQKSGTKSAFSDVQFDADDMNSVYEDIASFLVDNSTQNNSKNAANICAYSTSILLVVLVESIHRFNK